MTSHLHMQVASLQIEDQIRRASTARLADQAKQASQPTATRVHGLRWRRVFAQSPRRA